MATGKSIVRWWPVKEPTESKLSATHDSYGRWTCGPDGRNRRSMAYSHQKYTKTVFYLHLVSRKRRKSWCPGISCNYWTVGVGGHNGTGSCTWAITRFLLVHPVRFEDAVSNLKLKWPKICEVTQPNISIQTWEFKEPCLGIDILKCVN